MKSQWKIIAAIVLFLCLLNLGCLLLLNSYGRKNSVPTPNTVSGSGENSNLSFYHWKEGLNIMIVDDINPGEHTSNGSSSPPTSWVYREHGSAKSYDGSSYKWQFETADGQTGTFKLDDKDYDLTKGTLFVVKTKGGHTEVLQLKRDLSSVPPDFASCETFIKDDHEAMKFLKKDEKPK